MSVNPVPDTSQTIEIRVAQLQQLFNAIDPSPFHERDLDPSAEQFIVDWAQELPTDALPTLVVYLERGREGTDEEALLRDAVHEFFGRRAVESRRRLRGLFRRGRISLAIALAFLGSTIAAGDALTTYLDESRMAGVLREGLLIGGWVAMWRPLEVFLYDWWPIRAEARLFDRLSAMPVTIRYRDAQPA